MGAVTERRSDLGTKGLKNLPDNANSHALSEEEQSRYLINAFFSAAPFKVSLALVGL
jgi:hypothetical protein